MANAQSVQSWSERCGFSSKRAVKWALDACEARSRGEAISTRAVQSGASALAEPVVIVDTTVWVDYLNLVETPETEWLDTELPRQPFGLLDLMVCEILQGLSDEEEATRVLKELRPFEVFETGGVDLAIAAAKNYRTLRAKGRTVRQTMDCLIATFCLREGHSLLHSDRHFDSFEELLGLSVVHPRPRLPQPSDKDE